MKSKNQATQARVAKILAGKKQSVVSVRAKLQGRAGELWTSLLKTAEGIGLEPQDVVALLLDEGAARVEDALRVAATGIG